jgi:hypothetical protein
MTFDDELARRVQLALRAKPKGVTLRRLAGEVQSSLYHVRRVVALLKSQGLVEEIEAGKARVILPSAQEMLAVGRPTRLLWGLLGEKRLPDVEAGQRALERLSRQG